MCETLSQYIAKLQKIMEEHGDMPIGTSIGKSFHVPTKPAIAFSIADDIYTILSDTGDVKVCVIDHLPEPGHPYYHSLASRDLDDY